MKSAAERTRLHHAVYIGGLAILLCCLPLSRYVLSLSQFLLAANWILEGRFRQKLSIIRINPSIWIFMAFMFMYIIGFLYSSNHSSALTKIKNFLPLVIVSLVISTSAPLKARQLTRLFDLYCLSVVVAAWICLVAYYTHPEASVRDFRKISLFMPHIRFALLIIMAVFIQLYEVFFKSGQRSWIILARIAAVLFLIGFLFVLRSFSGIIILFITGTAFTIAIARTRKILYWRLGILYSLSAAFSIVIFFVAYTEIHNFHARPVAIEKLEKKTANGNPYKPFVQDNNLENGHYVNLYICEKELQREWARRSTMPFYSGDHKGQPVRITLIRYLTSMNLRKDSAGISKLSHDDISAIENGRANYRFKIRPGIYQRLYETLWEIHIWKNSGFAGYHSFAQRIVYLKTAGEIIRNHFFTGVGSGDVYDTMLNTVRENGITVERKWKGEPHNQFTFIFMSFGIFGFLWVYFCWIWPAIATKAYRQLMFNLFAAVILISMTILDTLESYDNVVFFGVFYSILVFNYGLNLKEDMMVSNTGR